MSDNPRGTSDARWWRRRTFALGLALATGAAILAAASWGRGGGPDPAGLELQAAGQALSLGRLDEAAAALERARQRGGSPAEVDRFWGLLYARAGQSDDARPLLLRTWDRPGRGPDPEVAEALARIAMQRFELADAIAVLDRWALEAPSDPRPLVMRAEIDRRIGVGRPEAIGHLREALRRDPNCDAARLGLAEMLYLEARYAESARLYADYAARHPDDPAGHRGAAIAARAQGDPAGAALSLDRALALDPADTLALKERAYLDLVGGRPDEALRRLDRAVAADPFDPELRYQRSLVLGQLGRRDEAAADRHRSERLRREHAEMAKMADQLIDRPHDDALRCRAARWMIDHGRSDEGLQWARMVLRDRPDHPEANRLLADYHRRHGEPGLANFYQAQVASAPDPAAEARTGGGGEIGPTPPSRPSGR
jgi:tetratricopeptide (TPR) repeat protein